MLTTEVLAAAVPADERAGRVIVAAIDTKRGDLYVVVQINVPKKITEREKEIWRELAKLHGG